MGFLDDLRSRITESEPVSESKCQAEIDLENATYLCWAREQYEKTMQQLSLCVSKSITTIAHASHPAVSVYEVPSPIRDHRGYRFGVLWDEDTDPRVLEVVEDSVRDGWIYDVLFFSESKGFLNIVYREMTWRLQKIEDHGLQVSGDFWTTELRPPYSETYGSSVSSEELRTISKLFELGWRAKLDRAPFDTRGLASLLARKISP